jgi:hypothetical protein
MFHFVFLQLFVPPKSSKPVKTPKAFLLTERCDAFNVCFIFVVEIFILICRLTLSATLSKLSVASLNVAFQIFFDGKIKILTIKQFLFNLYRPDTLFFNLKKKSKFLRFLFLIFLFFQSKEKSINFKTEIIFIFNNLQFQISSMFLAFIFSFFLFSDKFFYHTTISRTIYICHLFFLSLSLSIYLSLFLCLFVRFISL